MLQVRRASFSESFPCRGESKSENPAPEPPVDVFERSPRTSQAAGPEAPRAPQALSASEKLAVDKLVQGGVRKRLNLELREALSDLQEAVAKDPRNWFALANQAACLARMSQWAEARQTAEKALAINPQSALAELVVEVVEDYVGHRMINERLLCMTLKYPASDAVFAAVAVLYLGLRQKDMALLAAKKAMQINPENWIAGDALCAASNRSTENRWTRGRDCVRHTMGVLALPVHSFGPSEAEAGRRLESL